MLEQLESVEAAIKALGPVDPTRTLVMHPDDAAELLTGAKWQEATAWGPAPVEIRENIFMPRSYIAHLDGEGRVLRVSKVASP